MPIIERPMATKNDVMPSLDANVDPNTVSDIVAYVEEGKESALAENNKLGGLVGYIQNKFYRARDRRFNDEQRWIQCYQNYRGIYGPDVQFTDTEKSRAFIKITKTKVAAAHAQVVDVLFAGGRFPIGVEPTPVPTGIAEAVYFDPKEKKEYTASGYQSNGPQGGTPPTPGAPAGPDPNGNVKSASPRSSTIVRQEIIDSVGPYRDQLERVKDKLHEGYGTTPTSQTFEPAIQAAKNMEKMILDQLEEAEASKHLRAIVFDMALYGTGVMKGPFALDKEYPKWDDKGKYTPVIKTIPDINAVSIWDAYPDPDARMPHEMEHFIQRHRYSRSQLRSLKRRPHFRDESIEEAIRQGSNYINEYWEHQVSDKSDTEAIDRWEVLEYWGVVDKEIAEEANLTIPEALQKLDEFQVNVWVCQNQILRLVLNPFTPARIPYHLVPYEHNPYSIFGVGVAENMLDTQLAMNGAFRLAIDNAVLSSNLIFEIDETNLVPGQDLKVYPGKIFRRQAGAPGQALFSTKFQNVTNENFVIFDKARQLADEATGMPSYAHGQGGIQGIGRTASGMSMLMGAAAQNIKSVVRNIDDFLLAPLGKALFAFNMQFNFDKKLQGDLDIVARGTESLMRNEVRSQKLLQFLQLTANPMDAAFAKRDYLLRELAASLDLDPDKAVNDPREAAIQAMLMAEMAEKMGKANPVNAKQQTEGGNPSGAPSPSDSSGTGGGNIAPGNAPTPGEQGFSSNGGTGGQPPQG